jgi:long-chain acyl-CoA synthetase
MKLAWCDNDLPLQSLYRWERDRAGRVFLTQPFSRGKVREWTWAETASEVRRVAAYLQARGFDPGSRIGILARNSASWVMADLAIWMAGHVTVPIYPSLHPASVRRILEHSDCRACFFGATDVSGLTRLGIPAGMHRIALPGAAEQGDADWNDIVRTGEALNGQPKRSAEQLATIVYTSGTTGQPRGVMHRFGALAADAVTLRTAVRGTGEDRFISYLPLAHILERCGLEISALLVGARIFFVEGLDTFVDDLKRARPTLFISVPRLLLKFQQGVFQKVPREKLDKRLRLPLVRRLVGKKVLAALGLASARIAACGAAPLPPDLLLWYRRVGLPLVEGYGMTETAITHLAKTNTARAGYVGAALDGVETRITPEGELLIRSAMNMVGYYKEPDATRAAFDSDGFFHTGDLVTMNADGQIRIIGRAKEQFKTSKGKYVAPAPIESLLAEHPDVDACCLMGAGLPSPFAVVLLTADARERTCDPEMRRLLEDSVEHRLSEVNRDLDPHERVAFLVIAADSWTIENGAITPTLKIRRTVLESRYLASIDGWRAQDRRIVWDNRALVNASQAS